MSDLNDIIIKARTPQWDRFYGNNHEVVPDRGIKLPGCVDMRPHFGKPLSQRLWEDLVLRMGFRCLRIYRPGSSQWADHPYNCAVIELDPQGNVEDIRLWPR